MKVSQLIARLEAARVWAKQKGEPDPEVVVGERNGEFVSMIDVNVNDSLMVTGEEGGFTAIVQAYTVMK